MTPKETIREPQSIEEAAREYADAIVSEEFDPSWFKREKAAFEAGAKSDAAKHYWFKHFKL